MTRHNPLLAALLVGLSGAPGCGAARAGWATGALHTAHAAARPGRRHDGARASVALRQRLDAVAQSFREHDAQPFAERWVTYLPAAGTDVMTVTTERDQCLGFVAVGRESLHDIDLSIQNAAGARLAEDEHGDPHPYVRTCVHAGDVLYVTVRVGQGGGVGEVGLLGMAHPPIVPPDLDSVLGVRATGAFAPRQPRIAVGEDPAASDAARRALGLAQRLEPLGYHLVRGLEGAFGPAQLREEYQRHFESVDLARGACYAMLLAGDGIDRLSMAVVPPDGAVVQAPEATDTVQLRVCTRRGGAARVAFQALSDGGSWNLALLAMDPAIELADDVVGLERAAALEIAGEARRHGMALLFTPMREAAGATPSRLPVLLHAGRCYLFGAAASEALPGLEMAIGDAHGVVLASDTSGDPTAKVYYCATRTTQAYVDVHGLVGHGEFVLLGFESGAGGGP